MADSETLKLPKPLVGTGLRNDFLNFPVDRRWDLLGFVRSDDIEEIKSCSIGSDGHRYYLLQWRPSWKAESSLVYCEKLLQEFWTKKASQQSADIFSWPPQYPSINRVSSPEKTDLLTHCDVGKDKTLENELANFEQLNNIVYVSSEQDVVAQSTVSSNMVANAVDADFEKASCDASEQNLPDDFIEKSFSAEDEEPSNVDAVVGDEEAPSENEEANNVTDDASLQMDKNLDCDLLSIKGANKRKARPPRQSVPLVNVTLTTKKKLKRAKERVKKAKDTMKNPKSSDVAGPSDGILQGETSGKSLLHSNLKCMVCDKFLSSEQNLMKHLLTHNNNHTCPVCNKTFKSTHFLKHHMDKHNSSYQYSCPVCNKMFKFQNNMRGHLRKHNMEKKFECDICQKKFIGRYNLKEHMKAHSDERPFECDFCKKAYKDRGALNKHMLSHQEKKVECEVCSRSFTNQSQVDRHMQFHYSWPGDSFKRKTNTGPNGEKLKHKCHYCFKTFNHYSNMNAHLHKKHKEKKVQCTECPKQFAYQYELREHMFVHTNGEASKFKCKFCDKSFQRSTTLKNHERTTHLGIKRFKCDVCGKMFGTKFNMKVHVDKLHDNNEDGKARGTRLRAPKPFDLVQIDKPIESNSLHALDDQLQPQLHVEAQSVWRNMNTSDIIRNAMSHIPDLSYFTALQQQPTRPYQLFSIPNTDFNVT